MVRDPSINVYLQDVEDVDATCGRLLASGAILVSSPHDFLSRLRAAWVADPEGSHVPIVMSHTAAPA
jgi:hypothetical protein